jgi:hypothetical protein
MSARRREVSSPPRRGRFDRYYDAFDYGGGAPGPLAGQGPWVLSPFSSAYPSLLVRNTPSGGGVGSAGDGTSAATLALAEDGGGGGGRGEDLSRPFSLSFTLAWEDTVLAPGGVCNAALVLGNEDEAHVTLSVNLINYVGVNHARLYLTDDLGGSHWINVLFPFGSRHRVTLTWDGAVYRAAMDGAEVMAFALRNPTTIPLKDVTLEIACFTRLSHWAIYDFAVQLGAG